MGAAWRPIPRAHRRLDRPLIPAPLRHQVRDAIARAWTAAIESGALPALADDVVQPAIEVERPAHEDHGDLATNLAMKLARPYRKAPLEIATVLAAKLVRDASANDSPIEAAEVAPPGFLNVRIRSDALAAIVDGILTEPDAWGTVAPIRPRAVNVETNADSPPTARFNAPKTPPFISEFKSIFADIETIAPASAEIDCSGCKLTTAKAKEPG